MHHLKSVKACEIKFQLVGHVFLWMDIFSPFCYSPSSKTKSCQILLIDRVLHMSWYGILNGCGTKIVKATSTKSFKATWCKEKNGPPLFLGLVTSFLLWLLWFVKMSWFFMNLSLKWGTVHLYRSIITEDIYQNVFSIRSQLLHICNKI